MDDHQPQARREEYWSDPIAVNRRVVEQYRATGGHVDGFSGPSRMLLLTTSGARTGRPHTTPMMYVTDGDRLVVFASNIGAQHHPGWYHNLVADPNVIVEIGGERFPATAAVTTGEERERLWRQFPFPEHQDKTRRQIPVVVLERRPA